VRHAPGASAKLSPGTSPSSRKQAAVVATGNSQLLLARNAGLFHRNAKRRPKRLVIHDRPVASGNHPFESEQIDAARISAGSVHMVSMKTCLRRETPAT
jgi:hypothetical protein